MTIDLILQIILKRKKRVLIAACCLLMMLAYGAAVWSVQSIPVYHIEKLDNPQSLKGEWLFSLHDDPDYKNPDYNVIQDDNWQKTSVPLFSDTQYDWNLLKNFTGTCWLRVHFTIRFELAHQLLGIDLGRIHDADETYLNGHLIGQNGQCDPLEHAYQVKRVYPLPQKYLNTGVKENILTIRMRNFQPGYLGIMQHHPVIGHYDVLMQSKWWDSALIYAFALMAVICCLIVCISFYFVPSLNKFLLSMLALFLGCFFFFQDEYWIQSNFLLFKRISYSLLYIMPFLFLLYYRTIMEVWRFRILDALMGMIMIILIGFFWFFASEVHSWSSLHYIGFVYLITTFGMILVSYIKSNWFDSKEMKDIPISFLFMTILVCVSLIIEVGNVYHWYSVPTFSNYSALSFVIYLSFWHVSNELKKYREMKDEIEEYSLAHSDLQKEYDQLQFAYHNKLNELKDIQKNVTQIHHAIKTDSPIDLPSHSTGDTGQKKGLDKEGNTGVPVPVEINESELIHQMKTAIQNKNFGRAKELGNQILEWNKDSWIVYYYFGNIYRMNRQYQEALSYYRQSEELNPDNPAVLYEIGITYYNQKQFQEAGEYWTKVEQFQPGYKNTKQYLSQVSFK